MRPLTKTLLCAVLAAAALLSAVFTAGRLKALGTESTAQEEYCLRVLDGRVAVYNSESGEAPMAVTEIYAASLPEADRTALSDGITVQGRKQLAMLLEDLGS